MKTLVLCVDRDNDIGVKTGLQAPLVGRDQNLAAATKLGLADPEDSDVNALLSAVSIYDGLQKDNVDAEVATICGDVRVGPVSDLVLTKQLDQVLEQLRPDRVFLVSDGAEDEAFSPIIGSRIRVDHVRRVYVRQTPTAESLYYTIGRQLKNPRVRRKIVAPLGYVLLLFGAIYVALPNAASGLALILAGLYFIMISLPFQSIGDVLKKGSEIYERVRDSVATGNLAIFFNVSALILILVGIFFGADTAGRNGGTSYVSQFLWFVIGSVWWIVIGTLLFEGGKVISAYLRHGRAPRHAVAVGVTFVALGLLVLGMTQILQTILGEYNPAASLPLIYLSMGLALFLVAVTGLSYRTREKGLLPAILVTDLDGTVTDQVKANSEGAIAVIHGHGDNGPAVRQWAPRFSGATVATTQSRPLGGLRNFGGFTDGDRAVFLADHFGAARIRLVGFDFEHPNAKDLDRRTKQRKLDWAYILLGSLHRDELEL